MDINPWLAAGLCCCAMLLFLLISGLVITLTASRRDKEGTRWP